MTASNQALSLSWPAFPLDKIFFSLPNPSSTAIAQNGSPVAPAFTTVPVAHHNNGNFFLDVQSSVDNSTWYDSGYEPFYFDAGTATYYPRWFCRWSVDATNINIKLSANDAAYAIYYRAVGYLKV